MVELLALGSLELWHHEQQHALGSVKERCVLAILIHARGEPVSAATLLDRVWDDEPPRTALETLHTYLSRLRGRLRRAVGDLARVERPSPRLYRLRVDPKDVDLLRFQRLRADADAAAGRGERETAIGLLRTAETLWRGDPLTEFTNDWAASSRARLIEDHRRVREERIRLELELGRHADLIGELHELAAQNPLAQRVIAQLMLALYRSGRHDEALELYRLTHRRLDVRQGIKPGAELRELHQRILRQDRSLLDDAAVTPPVAASESRNYLPRDTRDFTGRASELRILLAQSTPAESAETAMPLTIVHGMPGIGKTALAIHAAHQMRGSYPDGLFYVDLHAYSGHSPHDPAEALAALLHASGESGALPDSLDERAAKWRQWTARRRILIVLDNARNASQVSPLLPGAPTCRAIVTSRNRLTGLDGATSLFVDALSAAEATGLFTRIAGSARVSADCVTLGRVVNTCGGHPLTLQLLANHFRHHDSWDLHHLLDRLAQSADPLGEFDGSVTAAFQLTYSELSAPAQCLFRRLALHTGPDITLEAATALMAPETGVESEPIRRSVEELLDCHLLEEPVRDRYRFHDLARAFALRLCSETEPEPVRHKGITQLLDYYLTSAHRADRLTHPRRPTLPLGKAGQSPYAPEFAGPDEASVWLTVERANLLAAARTAATTSPVHAALFPYVLAESLKIWGTWNIAADLYDRAVTALRTRGDGTALARTLVERAAVLAQQDPTEALRCATEALALFQDRHDPRGCADSLLQSGRAELAAGNCDMALLLLDRALSSYRQIPDRSGEADCLNVQGAAVYYSGRHKDAFQTFRSVLSIREELNEVGGMITALNNMGELHSQQGQLKEARDYYERSLALVQRHGGRQELAILNTNLGAIHQETGQTARALECFQRALDSHRSGGDALGETNVLINIGTAYAQTGRRGEALLHFNMAAEVAHSIGNAYERQRALIGMADVQRDSGRFGIALDIYEQALEVARIADSPLGSAHALAGLARTALSSRSIEVARQYGAQAVTIYQSLEATAEAESLQSLLMDHGVTGS
ncbi:tetratricopeptide repeat protein [Streptomyces sp. NPDC050617]|uniref:AfsR/SARP family transcriptional regulator n=1 Tax=Streptomyces sp. NPDC050617 TaxID=3154628 RepID=UPI00342C69F4